MILNHKFKREIIVFQRAKSRGNFRFASAPLCRSYMQGFFGDVINLFCKMLTKTIAIKGAFNSFVASSIKIKHLSGSNASKGPN